MPHDCFGFELNTGIQAGRKRLRKDQVMVNVEVINDIINCLQYLSSYFDTLHHNSENLRVVLQFVIKLLQHRRGDSVISGFGSNDLVHVGTSASLQHTCLYVSYHFHQPTLLHIAIKMENVSRHDCRALSCDHICSPFKLPSLSTCKLYS